MAPRDVDVQRVERFVKPSSMWPIQQHLSRSSRQTALTTVIQLVQRQAIGRLALRWKPAQNSPNHPDASGAAAPRCGGQGEDAG
jgi:hypothetical protein